jgi:hypothetical protein
MKNQHLEHPEDSVLLGKQEVQNVINFLRERNSTLSVKYDGAPAIVFGINPENGKKFVGTKSVFNKKKVKINYTHSDIEVNHGNNPKVASILHTCLEVIPQLYGVYQGDFIGFGGKERYTPNTITYDFSKVSKIKERSIIIAAHTSYIGETMKDLEAQFTVPHYLSGPFLSIHFVDGKAWITSRRRRIDYMLNLASILSNLIKYPETKKEVDALKIAINKCIRENRKVDCISGNLLRLFNLLTQIKLLLMEGITVIGDDVDAIIDYGIEYEPCGHEGYVMSNQFGTYKLVNRRVFSYNNFNIPKNW